MEKRFEAFFAEATNAFQFLEQVYEYQRLKEILESPQDMRDTMAKLRYVGPRVGVEIEWYFANAALWVRLVELLKEKVFPRYATYFQISPSALARHGLNPSETARAVELETLGEVLGKKDKKDFLLYVGPNNRGYKKRMKMLEDNRQEVIAGLARATQTYATTILQGDTTIFSEVMKYATERQKKLNPNWHFADDLS